MGIDSAAHQGALSGSTGTIAVMGTGPEKVYPAKNSKLYEAINNDGGVTVTEFFPNRDPTLALSKAKPNYRSVIPWNPCGRGKN